LAIGSPKDAGKPAERMARDRRRQRVSPIMAQLRVSLCRGSGGGVAGSSSAIPTS
jgi:hypothetical protein